MDLSGKIRLADLLLQRDEAFVRVAECERQIQDLLGAPYPFPPPPELPSLRRKKPAKAKPPAAAGGVPRGAFRLRALKRPQENAYRVEYQRGDRSGASFLADAELLRRLLPLDRPEFRITAVAAVQVRAPDDYTVVESLWGAGDVRRDS